MKIQILQKQTLSDTRHCPGFFFKCIFSFASVNTPERDTKQTNKATKQKEKTKGKTM